MTFNCMIAGVGGQGTVLASKLIAAAAMKHGYKVRTTETIGMAQRGGSVVSHVRIGEHIYSPLIPLGKADALFALEPAEAVRQLPYLRKDGMVIVRNNAIKPVADPNADAYETAVMIDYLGENVKPSNLYVLSGGLPGNNPKALNVFFLGLAAGMGIFPFDAAGAIEEVIPEMLPERFWSTNLEYFRFGIQVMSKGEVNEHTGSH